MENRFNLFICIILFISLIVLTFFATKAPKDFSKTKKVINLLLIILLIYKIFEYLYSQFNGVHNKIPVEFSAITYFLFPLVVLFKIKSVEPFAVFSAIISGFFYLLAFSFGGKEIAYSLNIFKTIASLISHSILYFCGLAMYFNKNFSNNKKSNFNICALSVIIYSFLMINIFDFSMCYVFLFKLLDGTYLYKIVPKLSLINFVMPIYYIVLIALFIKVTNIFYKYNLKISLKRNNLIK